MPADEFYPRLTLALGLRKVRANLEWCEEGIALLRKRLKKAATRA